MKLRPLLDKVVIKRVEAQETGDIGVAAAALPCHNHGDFGVVAFNRKGDNIGAIIEILKVGRQYCYANAGVYSQNCHVCAVIVVYNIGSNSAVCANLVDLTGKGKVLSGSGNKMKLC